MTKLSCSASNCANNNKKYCCISSIDVTGNSAVNSEETCCSSFREKNDTFTNCTTEPNPSVNIACKAENCIHNSDKKCYAESIHIAGQSAYNDVETECSTFSCGY
ncbi:DUF1540 domain-containing protein [Clostridium sp. ATCC 25772]|uniref:DUF1540 domain-containing protein n=1 Tax=Clostridium sp. ATCC 25772 TaxID=1676991 RepID=UPI0007831C15|nr:DUF1540 domain-containing protein [Clostridium sp. ATCC 25772]